jgi:hypothetical protein
MRRFAFCARRSSVSLAASAQDFSAAIERESKPFRLPRLPSLRSFPGSRPLADDAGSDTRTITFWAYRFDYTYCRSDALFHQSVRGRRRGAAGFGHAGSNPSIDAKSLFSNPEGPTFPCPTGRIELWAHVIAGWERSASSVRRARATHAAFLAGGEGLPHPGASVLAGSGRLSRNNLGGFNANYLFGTGVVFSF